MIDHAAPVLLTGGTGFAGTHLLYALHEAGYQNLHATFTSQQPELEFPFPVELHGLDLCNQDDTHQLLGKIQPAQLYQLASLAAASRSFEEADKILTNNLLLQRHVLEAVRIHSPSTRILAISSADIYGYAAKGRATLDENTPLRPMNPYAVSKAAQEMLTDSFFLNYKLDIVQARPFNHIGAGQTPHFVVSAFAQQIAKIEKGLQEKMLVGNLEATRDFSDVRDVVRAYILLMEKGQTGEIYNIGSGQGWKIRQLLDTLIEMSSASIIVETDPARLRPAEVENFIANIDKIHALGWQPTHQLKDTLSEILMDWRNRV